MTRRALVLGGGGYAASAWEIGLVTGMAEAGIHVQNAELLVGTSSGARVAVHLASGVALEELFQRQVGPIPRPGAAAPVVDWSGIMSEIARAKEAGGSPTEILQRIGLLALATARGTSGAERRQIVAEQLPMRTWPEQGLTNAAVNAETGERRAFDRNSGIDLVDAVIASSAFFGWPPALFQGHHYIDGGFYSTDNSDLAAGFDRVLILALRPRVSPLCLFSIDDAVETLRSGGAIVEVVNPDEDSVAAFASISVMNPAVCEPAARAGRMQGVRLVSERGSPAWQY